MLQDISGLMTLRVFDRLHGENTRKQQFDPMLRMALWQESANYRIFPRRRPPQCTGPAQDFAERVILAENDHRATAGAVEPRIVPTPPSLLREQTQKVG